MGSERVIVGKGKAQMGYEQAVAELPRINDQLAGASDRYSTAYEDARAALQRCYAAMATEGAQVARLRARAAAVRAIVDRGPGDRRVIELGQREDPSLTAGLRDDAGEDAATHQAVVLNVSELIGGLARITGCSDEQKLAASRLRVVWERAQLGGAKAIDYSQVRVDTSGTGEDRTEIIGAAARQEYSEIVRALGLLKSSILERVIVHEMSLRDLSASMGIKWSGGGGKKAKLQLLAALNDLVDHLGLRPGAGTQPRPRAWNDASPQHYSGEATSR